MKNDDRSARQIARGKVRKAGDRSARLAMTLMKLPDRAIRQLAVDEELREAIDEARAVETHAARRRAERALAGTLRAYDLAEVEAELARAEEPAGTEVRQFHAAETWRARLIADDAALAEFPAPDDAELRRLIGDARRERDTGAPRGAAKALFRRIIALIAR